MCIYICIHSNSMTYHNMLQVYDIYKLYDINKYLYLFVHSHIDTLIPARGPQTWFLGYPS